MAGKKTKIAAGAAALLVVGAGGAWHVITANILKNTTAWLKETSAKTLESGGSYAITYDRVERMGFPSIGVRLVNPSYTLTLNGDDAEKSPPTMLSMKLAGSSDMTTDYLAKAYHFTSNGTSTITIDSGEDHIVAISDPKTMTASVTAKDRKIFDSWSTLDISKPDQVAAAIKGAAQLDIDAGVTRYKDAQGAMLFSSDKTAFHFANRSDEASINFDFAFEAKAMEVGEAYSKIIERLVQNVGPAMPMKLSDMPFSVARAGKQDMDVALSANVPLGMAKGAPPSGTIKMSKFHLKNNYYTFDAPMDMVLSEVGGQRNLTLKLDWMLDVAAAGGAEAQRFVAMIAGFAPPPSAESPVDPEALKQKIIAALPTVSTLGPITLNIDLDATSPASAAPTADDKPPVGKDSVSLRNFSFSHKRWGLEAKGETLNDANGAKVDFMLTCKQCDALTGDAFATAQGAQEAANIANPTRPQMALTPEFLANVNSTLAEIGAKNAAGDISFAFTSPKAGDVAVNGKPIAEVAPKLMALFMAVQPAPVGVDVPAEEVPAQ